MKAATVAVDIDDVILAEAAFIIKYSNEHWGHSLKVDDYIEDWRTLWAVNDEIEFQQRVTELHKPGVQSAYDFVDSAEEVLRDLSNRFRLVVLSSRRKDVQRETLDWIDRRLDGVFDECYFTGFWDGNKINDHTLTKGKMAVEIGANYLIDDQPKHCFSAAKEGVNALLFGDYGVSRGLDLPPGVTRCKTWQEVKDYFGTVG